MTKMKKIFSIFFVCLMLLSLFAVPAFAAGFEPECDLAFNNVYLEKIYYSDKDVYYDFESESLVSTVSEPEPIFVGTSYSDGENYYAYIIFTNRFYELYVDFEKTTEEIIDEIYEIELFCLNAGLAYGTTWEEYLSQNTYTSKPSMSFSYESFVDSYDSQFGWVKDYAGDVSVALQQQIDELTASLSEKTTANIQLNAQINALNNDKHNLNLQVGALTNEKNQLTTQNETLTNRVNTLETDNATLQTNLNTLTGTNSALNGQIDDLNEQKAELQTELNDKNVAFETLASEKIASEAALNSQISDLTLENENLNAIITALKAGDKIPGEDVEEEANGFLSVVVDFLPIFALIIFLCLALVVFFSLVKRKRR